MAKEKKEEMKDPTETTEETVSVAEETAQEVTEEPQAEQWEKEKQQLQDQLLRKMAEFDNFKKRTAKEKEELSAFVKVECVKTILSVIDNFERALATECADEGFKKGMEMIFQQYLDALKSLGVEEIEALGKPFDPNYHNAINQVQDDQWDENTVCQVFQKGYRIGEKVIRHAMVVVANP